MEQAGEACDVKLMRGLDEYLQVLKGILLPKSLELWLQGVPTKRMMTPPRRTLNIWPLIYSLALGRPEFALPSKLEALRF